MPFVVARNIWSDGGVTDYTERLTPSPLTLIAVGLVAPILFLILFMISLPLAVVAAIGVYALLVAALFMTAPVISVADGSFRAGRATIPLTELGTATGYRGQDAFRQRGPNLDARAWLCLRGWIDPVVRVEVLDPEDPTPYWLVSTRNPERLIAALDSAA
jgi:hypothetical protein